MGKNVGTLHETKNNFHFAPTFGVFNLPKGVFPLNRFESSKSGINLPTFGVFPPRSPNRSLIPDHSELLQAKSTTTRMVLSFYDGSFVTILVNYLAEKVLHSYSC